MQEAWYKSYGIHMNPNLAKNGYVCLSLLGTWYGRGCEKWIPHKSTVLQLLVSIQALVLNSQPYFNEPSMVPFRSRLPHNKKLSLSYNETVFLRSLCTITWVLHKPPMHFKRFVESHFRSRGRAILLACKAYMEGAMVGSNDLSRRDGKSSSMEFRSQLKPYFDRLLRDFKAIGADCEGIAA
ncbi:hypothetical protein Taro_037063 [Colocasia esculenta]|uniref:UBC core domain-containing protein n=1 Tax=Colocasia esculenta TaxID=4460 RepID=A0A843W8M9_COLES|nr:hypothetical protein [Colocasia esculenta]